MAALRAFFDETERPDPNYVGIGGCLFASRQLRKFRREWERLFAPYGGRCRMADLSKGEGNFRGLAEAARVRIEHEAGEIIRDRAEHTVAVLAYRPDFAVGTSRSFKSAYATCCTAAAIFLVDWLERQGRTELINYVFEDGYSRRKDRCEAKDHLLGIETEFMRHIYRYGSCAFLPKEDAMWLQSGDMLAWQGGRFLMQRWRERIGATNAIEPTRHVLKRLEDAGKLTFKILSVENLNKAMDMLGTPETQARDYEAALRVFREQQ